MTDEKDAVRFWASVDKTGKCWNWKRPCRSRLGPRFQYRGRDVKVARMAFYFHHGHWPIGGAVRDCLNALCCRPEHLLDVPQRNVPEFLLIRGRHRHGTKPRIEVCKRGHKMEGPNLGVNKIQRYCKACHNMNKRRLYKYRKIPGVTPWRIESILALRRQLSQLRPPETCPMP